MVEELTIQNYALIENVKVSFVPGLNVLTGETGAGKSILVGALGLLLGSRADSEIIRDGAQEAIVTGVFNIDTPEIHNWLESAEIPWDEGSLVLRRIVRPQKRGTCFILSTPVSRVQLEDLTSYMVDYHGQHEHQSLFYPEQQRNLLDRYSGLELDLKEFSVEFAKLSQLKKEWEDSLQAVDEKQVRITDLLNFINEFNKVEPHEGEIENLKKEKNLMDQHEKIHSHLELLLNGLWDNNDNVLEKLKDLRTHWTNLAVLDTALKKDQERFEVTYYELEDLVETLQTYRRQFNFNPERLEEINLRISLLHSLDKKYGPGFDKVMNSYIHAQNELNLLENSDTEIGKLEKKLQEQEKKVIQLALQISDKRQTGAKTLEKEIMMALADLGMQNSKFSVNFQRKIGDSGKPVCSQWGIDIVEFYLAANLGENLKPLKDTASGGELSRVMLALKSILSEVDNIPILVFDEIDTGIGGEMGQALGRYLKKLSQHKQVLCITHLASIAAYADHHVKIEKVLEGTRVLTKVRSIKDNERIEEVARMLSGESSDISLDHARELIKSHSARG